VQWWGQMWNFWTAHKSCMGEKDLTRNLLLNLKPRTTFNLTQNSTSFTDTSSNDTPYIRDNTYTGRLTRSIWITVFWVYYNLANRYLHPGSSTFLQTVGVYPTKIYDITSHREYITHKEVK
jgi:hypothetical protein